MYLPIIGHRKAMKNISRLLFILVAPLLMAACSSSKKAMNTSGASLTDTYWQLIEVQGQPVMPVGNAERQAHLTLHTGGRATGNGSCNQFSGNYELKENNRIHFSPMMATKMACPALNVESEFFKVLQNADSYFISGDTLQLFRARMAPQAKFIAVRSIKTS